MSAISGICGMFSSATGTIGSALSGAMAALGVVDVDEDGEFDIDDAEGHIFTDDPTQNRGLHFNDPAGNHYDF
ncbi:MULTISPECIES: hypothetical protein [unclassified Clostridium]|uniref:hypothetical protein n=1 Tax=unclassified Clostridium TaxID=2614128 RepID=UPI0013F04A6A|nr:MULTISPECIES: hypothetical protein [unclassified Clostridium]NFG61440.1 hypothetical protein [Clostridium botulinum]NFQ10422.1 hypothetical protein [Clostridium botulinum]